MAEEQLDIHLILKHVDQVDRYQPGEILRDGKGHFYTAISETEVVSQTKVILENLAQFLTNDHLLSPDQHIPATESEAGFMSAQDKRTLEDIRRYVHQLQTEPQADGKLFNRNVQDGILGRLQYSVTNENKLQVKPISLILDSMLFDTAEMELPLLPRPERSFENAMGEEGVRYDLVFLEIGYNHDAVTNTDKATYRLVNVADVNFKHFPKGLGTRITSDGIFTSFVPYQQYDYEPSLDTRFTYFEIKDEHDNPTGVFKCGDGSELAETRLQSSTGFKYAIPLFKVKMLNEEEFSPKNLNGKLHTIVDAELEILPVYNRVFLSHLNLEALLYEGVELLSADSLITSKHSDVVASYFGAPLYPIEPTTVLYVPFKDDDTDIVTGGRLEKKASYKRSLFGYMLDRSYHEGSYMYTQNLRTFTLDFMLDKEINDDTLIVFADTSFNTKFSISIATNKYGKKMLVLNDVMNRRVVTTRELPEKNVTFVKITRDYDIFNITLNYEGNTTSRSYEIDTTQFEMMQIATLNCPIGNVCLRHGIHEAFPIDVSTFDFEMNNGLVDHRVIGGKVPYYKSVTLQSDIEPSNISYHLRSADRWIDKDVITILKNGNESIMGTYPEPEIIITDILSSNKVKVSGDLSDITEKDSIKIIQGIENVLPEYRVLHVDADDNELTFEVPADHTIDHYIGYGVYKNDLPPLVRIKHVESGKVLSASILDSVDQYNIRLNLEEDLYGDLFLEYISVMDDQVVFPKLNSVVYLNSDNVKMEELKDSILVSNLDRFTFRHEDTVYQPKGKDLNDLRLAFTSKQDENITSIVEVDLHRFIFDTHNFTREDLLRSLDSITLHLRFATNGRAYAEIGGYKEEVFSRDFDTVEISLTDLDSVIEDGKLKIKLESLSATNSQTYIIIGVPHIYLHFNTEGERSFAELHSESGNLGLMKHFRITPNSIENMLQTEVSSVMFVYTQSPDQSMTKSSTYKILTLPYVVGKNTFYLVSVGNELKLARKSEQNEMYIYNLPDNPMMKGDE